MSTADDAVQPPSLSAPGATGKRNLLPPPIGIDVAGKNHELPFESVSELLAESAGEPEWIWDGFLAQYRRRRPSLSQPDSRTAPPVHRFDTIGFGTLRSEEGGCSSCWPPRERTGDRASLLHPPYFH
jgi:hypothetical protein